MKFSSAVLSCGVLSAAIASSAAIAGNCSTGLTFVYQQKSVNSVGQPVTGAIQIGCYGTKFSCDPRNGDTKCKKALPILCKFQDPAYPANFPQPQNVYVPDANHAWAAEVVGTTLPVQPCGQQVGGTLSGANAYCEQEFGPNWRVVEWHDSQISGGSGTDLQVFGGVGNEKSHFWVDINDQPNGTCWNRN